MTAVVELPQGWMGRRCRKWLKRAARQVSRRGLIIEVGSWRGRSTTVLHAHAPRRATILAVDTWAGTPDDPEQHERLYADAGDVYADFCANLREPINAGRVEPLRMTSLEAAVAIRHARGLRCADLVFIDADHRYEAVRADILAYLPLLKAGGIISGHDFNPETWPGVCRAVHELVPGLRTYKGTSVWWARVP